jgi:hypothetical protein
MSSQTRLKGKEKEQREVFLSEKNSYSLNAGLPFFPYSKIEKIRFWWNLCGFLIRQPGESHYSLKNWITQKEKC